ncbi:CMD domain protein [Humitalea rosea]|uniref:CMD domain protein n=1 Tax=Humitalea rosea TaxID=990373 RepID=A0A2W7IEL9_9PROT|nr:CMD domain protein [Humitalea rosea]PZW44909.1 CMD domain protein [Humitalea rosea]
MSPDTDLIEEILGLAPGSPLALLRAQRPEARQHAQGAFRELLRPGDPGGVSLAERAALALRVALREGDPVLAGRFRALVDAADPAIVAAEDLAGPAGDGRLAVLFRHADILATDPAGCGQAEIAALTALGLTPRDIVAITQLVSFVPYQIRLLAGLRLLQQEQAA